MNRRIGRASSQKMMTKIKKFLRPGSHLRTDFFEDQLLKNGQHYNRNPRTISHMVLLKSWSLTHAPPMQCDDKRVQELHNLTNQLWYSLYRRLWRLALIIPVAFMFMWKFVPQYSQNSSGQLDYPDSANYVQNPSMAHY